MPQLNDDTLVKTQYQDDARLNDRMQLYARYSKQPQSWQAWVFEHLRLQPGERVLELGCGNAALWQANLADLPDGIALVLTDNAPGMLDAAQTALQDRDNIEYKQMDAQAIDYPAATFDVLIANHMLYHVPSPAQVITEARRVLKPTGRFYVATNDWAHQQELRELYQRFGIQSAMPPPGRDESLFDFETAAHALSQVFSTLRLSRRRDELAVTDVEPIIRYMRSMLSPTVNLDEMAEHLQKHIHLLGAFHITAVAGIIEATLT